MHRVCDFFPHNTEQLLLAEFFPGKTFHILSEFAWPRFHDDLYTLIFVGCYGSILPKVVHQHVCIYIYPSIKWFVKWEIFVFEDVLKETCPKIFVKSNHYKYTYSYLYLPFSGNLSRVKTFANFMVSGQFAKVLTAEIFIGYCSVIINGRVIVVFHNSRKF